jgi:hypothetical protein
MNFIADPHYLEAVSLLGHDPFPYDAVTYRVSNFQGFRFAGLVAADDRSLVTQRLH